MELSNERMEYLGDRILGFTIEYLFKTYLDFSEGEMSKDLIIMSPKKLYSSRTRFKTKVYVNFSR